MHAVRWKGRGKTQNNGHCLLGSVREVVGMFTVHYCWGICIKASGMHVLV